MRAATAETASTDGGIGRGWFWFATATMAAVFLQSVTAGRILSGDHWARTTHRVVAGVLVFLVFAAGLAALVVLRDRTGGRQMAAALLGLAAGLAVEYRLGAAAADGEDAVWLHVPFGVAIVAVAAQANRLARRLAESPRLTVKANRHG